MTKSNFIKTLTVGLKAIAGAMVHYLIMAVLLVFFAFVVGGLGNIGPGLMAVLVLTFVILGIFILGWIYRSLWNWK